MNRNRKSPIKKSPIRKSPIRKRTSKKNTKRISMKKSKGGANSNFIDKYSPENKEGILKATVSSNMLNEMLSKNLIKRNSTNQNNSNQLLINKDNSNEKILNELGYKNDNKQIIEKILIEPEINLPVNYENIIQDIIKKQNKKEKLSEEEEKVFDLKSDIEISNLNKEIIKQEEQNIIINQDKEHIISMQCFTINLGKRKNTITDDNITKIKNQLMNFLEKTRSELLYDHNGSYPTILFIAIQKVYDDTKFNGILDEIFKNDTYEYILLNNNYNKSLELQNLIFINKNKNNLINNDSIQSLSTLFSTDKQGTGSGYYSGALITKLSINDSNGKDIPFIFINICLPSLNERPPLSKKQEYLYKLSEFLLKNNYNLNLFNSNIILLGSFNYNLDYNKYIMKSLNNTYEITNNKGEKVKKSNNICTTLALFKNQIDTIVKLENFLSNSWYKSSFTDFKNKLIIKKQQELKNKSDNNEFKIEDLSTLYGYPLLRSLYNEWLERNGYLIPKNKDYLLENSLIKNLFSENPIYYCQTCDLNTDSKERNIYFYKKADNLTEIIEKNNLPTWCDRIFYSINYQYRNMFFPFNNNSTAGYTAINGFFDDSEHLAVSQLFIINNNSNKRENTDNEKNKIINNINLTLKNYNKLESQFIDTILINLKNFIYRGSTPKY
jgi:hypothetical protein